MPVRRFQQRGEIQTQVLDQNSPGRSFPEYCRVGDEDNPDAVIWVGVTAGDMYGVLVTVNQGFEMGDFTHIRTKLFQPGQQAGPVKLPAFDYRNLPGYDETRLPAPMEILLKERKYCTFKGERWKRIKFGVDRLILDPTLDPSDLVEDLSKIRIVVSLESRFRKHLTFDEARRKFQNRRAKASQLENAPRRIPVNDIVQHTTVDEEHYEKGMQLVTTYHEMEKVKPFTPEELAVHRQQYEYKVPDFNDQYETGIDRRSDFVLETIYHFAPIEYLENGPFVRLENPRVKRKAESDNESDPGRVSSAKKRKTRVKGEIKEEIKEEDEKRVKREAKTPTPRLSKPLKRSDSETPTPRGHKRRRGLHTSSSRKQQNALRVKISDNPVIILDDDGDDNNSPDNPMIIDDDGDDNYNFRSRSIPINADDCGDDEDINNCILLSLGHSPSFSNTNPRKRARDEFPSSNPNKRQKRVESTKSPTPEIPDSTSPNPFDDEGDVVRGSNGREGSGRGYGRRLGGVVDGDEDDNDAHERDNHYNDIADDSMEGYYDSIEGL